MIKKYRHECKYILSALDAELMRDKISAICFPDSHATKEGCYQVRSLYFDTLNDQFLQENLSGVDSRHKYRIRVYNCDGSRIMLERKETESGLKHKESCRITQEQCLAMMSGNMTVVDYDPCRTVLQEMYVEHMLKFLQPKVIVDYKRIPFIYPSGNVRITFDHKVSSSKHIDDFLKDDIMMSPVLFDNSVVLEVKYDDILPMAIRKLINRYCSKEQTAFSKYVYARSNVKNG